MTATLAEQILPVFENVLATLDGILAKAESHGDDLLSVRLIDDMFPLATQIRFTCSQVVVGLKRLTSAEFTEDAADDATFAAARARIAATRKWLSSIDPAALPAPDAPVAFDLPNGMAFAMTAAEYVRDWSVPQAYFHLMTTYSILRSKGVPLGKIDFLPHMLRYAKAAAPA